MKIMHTYFMAGYLLSSMVVSHACQQKANVIELAPPNITREAILQKITCNRPMRQERFNISLKEQAEKTIVHCYGHGGYGWTTLFGSVEKAIQLYCDTNPKQDTPIRIIGSGCVGLTTAMELSQRGFKVAGICTKELNDIPSFKAAGCFAWSSLGTSPEDCDDLNAMALNTFRTYQIIEAGEHPYISSDAVMLMPLYANMQSGLDYLISQGVMCAKEDVTLDFGEVRYQGFMKYMSYFMNTTVLMRQLMNKVQEHKIAVNIKEIKSFDEVAEPVVFNCSGFGAKDLNADDAMYSARGHLLALNELAGAEHMKYMLCAKVQQDGHDAYVYSYPKNKLVMTENQDVVGCNGVIGGTFIPIIESISVDEQMQRDQVEFDKIFERASLFFNGQSVKGIS